MTRFYHHPKFGHLDVDKSEQFHAYPETTYIAGLWHDDHSDYEVWAALPLADLSMTETITTDRMKLVNAARDLWGSFELWDRTANEYLRGMAELICDITPSESDDGDLDKAAVIAAISGYPPRSFV